LINRWIDKYVNVCTASMYKCDVNYNLDNSMRSNAVNVQCA
jgi:hypothetical protein